MYLATSNDWKWRTDVCIHSISILSDQCPVAPVFFNDWHFTINASYNNNQPVWEMASSTTDWGLLADEEEKKLNEQVIHQLASGFQHTGDLSSSKGLLLNALFNMTGFQFDSMFQIFNSIVWPIWPNFTSMLAIEFLNLKWYKFWHARFFILFYWMVHQKSVT